MITSEQMTVMHELSKEGYIFNEQMSISAAGVILEKCNDIYFFGLSGEIMHNPTGFSITL